jgi:hypothetical protein
MITRTVNTHAAASILKPSKRATGACLASTRHRRVHGVIFDIDSAVEFCGW